MIELFAHGSGIIIITASGSSIPLITRNSSALSSIAESDPAALITGKTFWNSFLSLGDSMFSSRADILSEFPRIVLISPLCTINLFG